MSRFKSLYVFFIALILSSASCNFGPSTVVPPTVDTTDEPEPNDITPAPVPTVPTVPPTPISTGNCAISLNGQSFYISGGGGGLTTDAELQRLQLPEIDWLTVRLFVEHHTSRITPNKSVAILIVDDFRGDSLSVTLDSNEFGLPKPDSNGLLPLDLSHGELVYHHTITLLDELGYTQSSTIPSIDRARIWERSGNQLYLIQVDSASSEKGEAYNVNDIQRNISSVVETLNTQGVELVVVNKSFSIFPCNTAQEIEAYIANGNTFEDYVDQARQMAGIATFVEWLTDQTQQVIQYATSPNSEDALYRYINDNQHKIVFVAAAGNLGESTDPTAFYFYPGAIDGVINVSGLEGNGLTWWTHSNLGEIKLPAAWFMYVSDNPPQDAPTYYYAGTSFAAPIMSVIAALYLSDATFECPFDTLPPPFASVVHPNSTSIPEFAGAGQYSNPSC